jgi:hypothetical protein
MDTLWHAPDKTQRCIEAALRFTGKVQRRRKAELRFIDNMPRCFLILVNFLQS